MSDSSIELINRILADPLNESLRLRLEHALHASDPNCPEYLVLQLERQIAVALETDSPIGKLEAEYRDLLLDYSNELWDKRGFLDHAFRPFSLWLLGCSTKRRFALSIALENKLQSSHDVGNFPIELIRRDRLRNVLDQRTRIIDFVRRYRGPSGLESSFNEDEIEMPILASCSVSPRIRCKE